MAILRLRPPRQKTISIINCYSPTSAADKSEQDAFHEKLEEAIYSEKYLCKFVVVNFNAGIEMAEEAEYRIGNLVLDSRTTKAIVLLGSYPPLDL